MGKGTISPFPSVFKMLVSHGRQKVLLFGNGLIALCVCVGGGGGGGLLSRGELSRVEFAGWELSRGQLSGGDFV